MAVYISQIIDPCLSQVAAFRDNCIPPIEACEPNPEGGIITKCEETWNKVFCRTDTCWFMPFAAGDKLALQTRFRDLWNADPTAPADGWDEFILAHLVNSDTGEILSDTVVDFSTDYLVGYDGRGSYQLIEIDTAMAIFTGVSRFHIEFYARRQVGENEIEITGFGCSEDFELIENCDHYPIVEPTYKRFDGFGYWYGYPIDFVGTGSFKYRPRFRYPIDVLQIGGELETKKSGENITSIRAALVFVCELWERVPPYVANLWLRQILPSGRIKIDDKSYVYRGNGISRNNTGSEMLIFSINLYQDEQVQETC